MMLRWYGGEVKERISTFEERYLNRAGAQVAAVAAGNWRVRTGRGRASVHYVTSVDTPSLGQLPASSPALARPDTPATVRVGSALFYAIPYEKRRAWLSNAIDTARRSLSGSAIAIAAEVFR